METFEVIFVILFVGTHMFIIALSINEFIHISIPHFFPVHYLYAYENTRRLIL